MPLEHRYHVPQYTLGWLLTEDEVTEKYCRHIPDKDKRSATIHSLGVLTKMWEKGDMLKYYSLDDVETLPMRIPTPKGVAGFICTCLTFNNVPAAFEAAKNMEFLKNATLAIEQKELPKWHRMCCTQTWRVRDTNNAVKVGEPSTSKTPTRQ